MTNESKRLAFPLNLQLFAEDPQDPPADPPKDTDPPADKTFTQAELDALIADRLARERKKYADYDDLKKQTEEYAKAEEERKKAAMSEIERERAEKDEALKKAQEAEEARTKTVDTVNQRLIKSEIRLMAKELGVRAEALDDVYVLADRAAVTVDDEGNVVGAKEAVEALIKAKPYLAEAKKTPRQIGEPSNPDDKGTQKTKEQMLAEAEAVVRKNPTPQNIAKFSLLKRELNA